MKSPNYRISYSNKKNILIVIAMLIILLMIVFRPLSWLRKTLTIKSMIYKSTHDPVYFSSLNLEESGLPIDGTIIRNFSETQNGVDIEPSTLPTTVRPVDIGMVVEIGYNSQEKNYIKIRHVTQSQKDIFYTYYSNLPTAPNLKLNEWVGTSTVLYTGNDLDYLHFEVIDFYENKVNPIDYIKIE